MLRWRRVQQKRKLLPSPIFIWPIISIPNTPSAEPGRDGGSEREGVRENVSERTLVSFPLPI